MKTVDDLVPAYVLGTLTDDQRRAFDDELARSARLRREVDALVESLANAAADAVAPQAAAAPAAPRARLLATVAGVDRFAPFFADLTRLFELPVEVVRALLARIDQPGAGWAGWDRRIGRVALESSELFHFAVGPTLAASGAAGGVLRVRAGDAFPAHHHDGDETTYVLEGACLSDGRTYGPGSVIEMERGTAHGFSAAPERDLVVMVLHRGITFG